MPNIRTPFNYEGPDKEVNGLQSETVQDHALSVREILQRHSSGWPMSNTIPYFNEIDGEEGYELLAVDPRRLDLSERVQLAKEIGITIDQLRGSYGRMEKDGTILRVPAIPVIDKTNENAQESL